MAEFNRDRIEMFLGVVRKYMQIRGPYTQKELADLTEVGVSTMSRFLNQKTSDLNAQLIAKITAKLKIPLHEIIEFVEEDFTEQFVRLVRFFREEFEPSKPSIRGSDQSAKQETQESPKQSDEGDDAYVEALSSGTAQRDTTGKINVGGKQRRISFQSDHNAKNSELSIRDKMSSLSARQRGFLSDFLNLDMDGRDLIVDLGKNVITYLRQKGVEF